MGFDELPRHTKPIDDLEGVHEKMIQHEEAEEMREKGVDIVHEIFGDDAATVVSKLAQGIELSEDEKKKMDEVRARIGSTTH